MDDADFPPLQEAKHLPFVELRNYIEQTYNISLSSFWYLITDDDQTFKGNKSTMSFVYTFASEVFPEEIGQLLPFLDQRIFYLLRSSSDDHGGLKETLELSIDTLIELYLNVETNEDKIVKALGKKHQRFCGYLLSGMVEAIVVKLLNLHDLNDELDRYFWYFNLES